MNAHPRDRHSPDNGKGRRTRVGGGVGSDKRDNRGRDPRSEDATRNEDRSQPPGERGALPEGWHDARERGFNRYLAIDEESE